MRTHARIATALLCLTALSVGSILSGCSGSEPATPEPAAAEIDGYRIADPVTHDNLTVFFLHGEDRIQGEDFLTLEEALKDKSIVIRETGNVRELKIKNLGKKPVFIQSGEIIRGGKQDRMLPYDYIVPPESEEMELSAFCVERGRWSRRGAESAGKFSSSDNLVNSNDTKVAALVNSDQGIVWASVSANQELLSTNTGADVRDKASRSSLELTLSSKEVKEATEAYLAALDKSLEGKTGVIGMAVAINGKVYSVDTYASSALFRKLYLKLLRSASVEAVAQKKKDATFQIASAEDVRVCVLEAKKAKAQARRISDKVTMEIRSAGKLHMSGTLYSAEMSNLISVHESVMVTGEPVAPTGTGNAGNLPNDIIIIPPGNAPGGE